MNKTAIKKFAVESRQKLIKSTIERLEELGITDKEVVEVVELGGVYSVKSQTLTEGEKKNREIILSKIEEKGYESFVEEVAYTWFNRIIAIRYMEVNDYLPFRTRVLSSEIQGKVDPDIITEIADHIEELELNRDKVIELKEHNKQEELFKYVFIKVCNYFGQLLSVMFEQIEDYTELLLPSVMISNGSVIKDMIELVPEEDWRNQVEIIGWLYQYYISEKKDQVFADLKKNKKITKDNIPAATQLFTPEWIVKYMVENSLGRLWLEGHPNEELKSKWKYYLEEAEQKESVKSELEKIKKESEILTPEDLTILDPAMGSGHILVYAFDVLYQIYQSEGYSEKEIPRLILEKNIYGLDIDDRAGQLAYFALMMKARSYSRRFFSDIKKNKIEINICSIQESNALNKEDILYFSNGEEELKHDLEYLVCMFIDAKEYGSILDVKKIDFENLVNRLNALKSEFNNLLKDGSRNSILSILPKLMLQYRIMCEKYDVLCTNPPYMGRSSMDEKLKVFLDKNFSKTKADLFAVFMELDEIYLKKNRFMSMINQHSWMFLSSFEKLRQDILTNKLILNMTHLGARAFDEIGGEVVQSTAFVILNSGIKDYKSSFVRLVKYNTSLLKKQEFNNIENLFITNQAEFMEIPGNTIAYWVGMDFYNIFKNYTPFKSIGYSFQGMITGNNNYFLRLWHEIKRENLTLNLENIDTLINTSTWLPYNKGGGFRKWYGNNNYVLRWEKNGVTLTRARTENRDYYLKEGITWSFLTTGIFSSRYFPNGFLWDVSGSSIFSNTKVDINILLAIMNSCVGNYILNICNPTLNYQVENILSLPYIDFNYDKVIEKTKVNIALCKKDWDSFEESWDFKIHPLLNLLNKNQPSKIISVFSMWETECEKRFLQLKSNEEELNNIFIDIYRLHDELTSSVEDKDVTIRKANRDRDIKSFISYAVGCMMGRYSLDEEGLIFAGGEFDESKYQTFKADNDGIILISDTEYFEDDLLNRFVEFVKVVYGEETLEENLNFIADTECFKRKATESSRDCLRRYFLKGFMEDHLKVYQKRPIYWMFDSGKQNGFKALIYLHRYNEDMVAKVRTDYLHPLQRKYEAELERLDDLINFENISAAEKGKAKKRQEQIHKQLDECTQYDLLLAHVANQRIALDLDDGVKVNYQKFQNIELTADGTSKTKKGDLLYKVKM